MLNKHDHWYADWRDASGKRHRKAFTTKRAALAYQSKMHGKAVAERHPRPTKRQRPSREPSR